MNFASDEQRFSLLSEETKHRLSNLWVIKGTTLKQRSCFPVFEEVRHQLVRLPINNGKIANFISHRWHTKSEPDPYNYQYELLRNSIKDDAFYWYDYSCIPQNPMTDVEHHYIDEILHTLNDIVRASKVIIFRNINDDYFSRGWCFHEWFTAQFCGFFDRGYLTTETKGNPMKDPFHLEIVQAKRNADRLFCYEYSILDDLKFTKDADRQIVTELTKSAAVEGQKTVARACLEVINGTIGNASYAFPDGLAVTSDDIHQLFPRLIRFIKIWTEVLQPVEPVTDRIAMFFHRGHWEALINISHPIAVNLLSLEYRVELRSEENSPVEKELRKVYEFCQMKMPETRYAVTAFLCFFLMGYDIEALD